jgi:hypothetical protein
MAADPESLVQDGETPVGCRCRQDNRGCGANERRKSATYGSGYSAHQKGPSPHSRPLSNRTRSKHSTVSTFNSSRRYSPRRRQDAEAPFAGVGQREGRKEMVAVATMWREVNDTGVKCSISSVACRSAAANRPSLAAGLRISLGGRLSRRVNGGSSVRDHARYEDHARNVTAGTRGLIVRKASDAWINGT